MAGNRLSAARLTIRLSWSLTTGLRTMNRACPRSLFSAAKAGSKSSRFFYLWDLQLHAQGLCSNLGLSHPNRIVTWARKTTENSDAGKPGNNLFEKLKPFSYQLVGKVGQSRNLSARSRQTSDKTTANGIVTACHNRNRQRRVLSSLHCG